MISFFTRTPPGLVHFDFFFDNPALTVRAVCCLVCAIPGRSSLRLRLWSLSLPVALRDGRQPEERPVLAAEEHAAAVTGLYRAAPRHRREQPGAGELAAIARVAP